MKLGKTIREERERRGWSIDALVEQIGDVKGGDRASLSKIENDQRWPRPTVLAAVARAYGMKVYQLVALAEGVMLPVAKVAPEEREFLKELRVMTPDARDHYLAIARALAEKKS